MKKQILMVAGAAGVLLGGFGLSQFIDMGMQAQFQNVALKDLPSAAYKLVSSSTETLAGKDASAIQINQVQAELNTSLQLAQIRQNAEIIRLLGVIAAKK